MAGDLTNWEGRDDTKKTGDATIESSKIASYAIDFLKKIKNGGATAPCPKH